MPYHISAANALKKLQGISPPFQPSINMQVCGYREKKLDWNVLAIKKGALYYQFKTSSETEQCKIQIVPDACLNMLFECGGSHPNPLLSGPFLKPGIIELKRETEYFGFKPYSWLGLKTKTWAPKELLDSVINFTGVFPSAEELVQKIAEDFLQIVKQDIPFGGTEDRGKIIDKGRMVILIYQVGIRKIIDQSDPFVEIFRFGHFL
jgi:hypothetical protein